MATSANGIIATENGNEDFLSDTAWEYFVQHTNKVGCVIWGMNTQKAVLKWPQSYFDDIKNVTKIVISRNSSTILDKGFFLARSIDQALKLAEKQGFNEVVLSSGGTINTEFVRRKLIDEVTLTIDSVIIGKGITLFKPEEFELNLKLVEMKRISDETIALRYTVTK